MRPKRLLFLSVVLLVAGLVSLGKGWNGTGSIGVGLPMRTNSVQICGSSTGVWAFGGLLGVLGGVVVLLLSLISAISRGVRPRAVK